VAWLVEERGYVAADTGGLCAAIANMTVECQPRVEGDCEIIVNGENISAAIRHEKVGERASELAPIADIRAALAGVQKQARKPPGLISS